MQPQIPDDDDQDTGDLGERTRALQQRLALVERQSCRGCGAALCGHAAVLAVVFGCQHAPRCPRCLAAETGEAVPSMVGRALQWIVRRDCFLHVWRAAGQREGNAAEELPACVVPVDDAGAAPVSASARPVVSAAASELGAAVTTAVAHYDAGDLGCGDLVLELRFRLADLPPGAVLRVTARDPAAPVDLPAWCGLCGHQLMHAAHPDYWIRRRERP